MYFPALGSLQAEKRQFAFLGSCTALYIFSDKCPEPYQNAFDFILCCK